MSRDAVRGCQSEPRSPSSLAQRGEEPERHGALPQTHRSSTSRTARVNRRNAQSTQALLTAGFHRFEAQQSGGSLVIGLWAATLAVGALPQKPRSIILAKESLHDGACDVQGWVLIVAHHLSSGVAESKAQDIAEQQKMERVFCLGKRPHPRQSEEPNRRRQCEHRRGWQRRGERRRAGGRRRTKPAPSPSPLAASANGRHRGGGAADHRRQEEQNRRREGGRRQPPRDEAGRLSLPPKNRARPQSPSRRSLPPLRHRE